MTATKKSSFINPYHFLSPGEPQQPINREDARRTLLPKASEADAESAKHLRHDQYGQELHSGRIVCRLTTESPCVFGNEHVELESGKTKGWGSIVRNLLLKDDQGRTVPAASATSLKGMISHLIEACSGSAMRVQHNTALSYRSDYRNEGRTAIGMIITVRQKDEQGKTQERRKLLPLTLPQTKLYTGGRSVNGFAAAKSILAFYRNGEALPWYKYLTQNGPDLPVRQAFPIYVEGYKRTPRGNGYKDHDLRAPDGKPIGLLKGGTLSYGHHNQDNYWKVHSESPIKLSTARTSFAKSEQADMEKAPISLGLKLDNVDQRDWINCFHHRSYMPLTQRLRTKKKVTLQRDDADQIDRAQALKDLTAPPDSQPVIGILRRLSEPRGPDKEEPSCPGTKYHEMLIPVNGFFDAQSGCFPWDQNIAEEDQARLHRGLLDVEQQASDFEGQARELAELHKDSRPFRLRDTADKKKRFAKLTLRHGDLVHFRLKPGPVGTVQTWFSEDEVPETLPDCKVEVDSLAISAIWRENAQDVYTFLRGIEEGEAEQRPMSPSRETITMAEGMFGFVDGRDLEGDSQGDSPKDLTALAGRIRFSAALLSPEHSDDLNAEEYQMSDVWLPTDDVDNLIDIPAEADAQRPTQLFPLRILSSPKLPCPAMYFEWPGDASGALKVSEDKLRTLGAKHKQWMQAKPEQRRDQAMTPIEDRPRPRGFKWYLHDPTANQILSVKGSSRYRWQTADDGKGEDSNKIQKALVRPLKPGLVFYFHVDYFNLTNQELAMLQFALRPSNGFRHKLGFGKPLGLGTVRIDPIGNFVVDRHARYRCDTIALGDRLASRYARVQLWPERIDEDQADDWESTSAVPDSFGAGVFDGDDSEPESLEPESPNDIILPPAYALENGALQGGAAVEHWNWIAGNRAPAADCVSPWFWNQLEVLGNPQYVAQLQQEAVVAYPLKRETQKNRKKMDQLADWEAGKDVESFRWFANSKPLCSLRDTENVPLESLARRLLMRLQ